MANDQPDKRTRPELPKDSFGDFQYRQALAEEMLPIIGRIYRDNVHLLLYGKPLVNLSVSELMQAHRFVRETEDNELSEFETYQVIACLNDLALGPAEVDIGIIAAAYLFDNRDLSIDNFVKESVEDFQKSLKDVTHEEVMQFVLLTQYFDTLNNVGSNSKNN